MGWGDLHAEIDTPHPTPSDAVLQAKRGADGGPTGINFDLIDGSNPKETRLPGLYIRLTRINDHAKGKGVGVWFYRQLIDWADRQGLPSYSDFSVSEEAQAIYPALERRGYKVEQINPFLRDADGGIINPDFRPIFRISRTPEATAYESAPAPIGDYQLDGPTLRDRIKAVEDARAREEAYQEMSPAEQAIADSGGKMLFSVNGEDGKPERISARDMLARTFEQQDQAREMGKGFEAAAKCAARNAATQVLRSVPTAASFVTLRATAASALPSADAAIGQVLGLGAAIPLGITGAPVILNVSRRASLQGSMVDNLAQEVLPLSQRRQPQGSNDERFPTVPGATDIPSGTPEARAAIARSYGASPADTAKYAAGDYSGLDPNDRSDPPITPSPNVDVHVAPADNPRPAPQEDTAGDTARILTEFLQSGKRRQ